MMLTTPARLGASVLLPRFTSGALRTAAAIGVACLVWAPASAQVFNFNAGANNLQGWTLVGAFTQDASGSSTAGPLPHNFGLSWDDATSYPSAVNQDGLGNGQGSARMWPMNGSGIVPPSQTHVWWIMQLTSPDLTNNAPWQSAVGYSVRLRNTMAPGALWANLYVRVFDNDQFQERTFFSGTAQAIGTANWVTFTFDWSGFATFPTSYTIRSIFIDVWGQTGSAYTSGGLYFDDITAIQDTTPPTVNITGPTSSPTYSTTSNTIVLTGSAADNERVTRVSWSNDRGGSGLASGTTSWSSGSIPLMPGTNVLTVTARDVAQNTAVDRLTVTYTPPPVTITTLTPARGSTAGGTAVRVIGDRFVVNGTSVTVGGQPATNVVVSSATELSFVTPPGNAGAASVQIATANASGSGTFTYVVPDARRLAGARKPSFSYDGRYMAFESPVALVPEDTNGVTDVYVFDKVTGTVRRVSVSSAGGQGIGGESTSPAISATGRFVAFESRASNLVLSDVNNLLDVYLHDRDADNDGIFDERGAIRTVRVSVSTAGAEAREGFSRFPSISGNGRWVTFESAATNLVGSDTNRLTDICVHDRLLGITKRLNVQSGGTQSMGGHSARPRISQDGRWVVFDSLATNLVDADTNGVSDVFLHDRDTDGDGVMDEAGFIDTRRISVNSRGEQGNAASTDASLTGDGRWVVFASLATNLDVNQQDTNGESDIFLHDRLNRTTRRVSLGPNNAQFVGPSRVPRISADGSLLVFLTSGLNAPPAAGAVAAAATSASGIHLGLDDGKSTTGSIPSPTAPTPPPATVDPPSPTENAEDPEVSGDGSQTGTTVAPTPGSGTPGPSVETEGVPEAAVETPFISGLSPAQGVTTGNNLVQIQGSHFSNATSVEWGAFSLVPNVVNDGLIQVTAPGGAVGSVTVQVRKQALGSNLVTYTYQAALSTPVITQVNPASGPVTGGEVVTISGTGFAAPSVRFGPAAATVTGSSATSITVTTPPTLVAGPVPVVVTNGDGAVAVSGDPYTYLAVPAAPTILTVEPSSGPVVGGTSITIIGTGFADGATVAVGGAPATDVQVLSSAALMATTPAGVNGSVAVRVTANGQTSNEGTFTYGPVVAPITACTGTTDADADGVPDDWETQYGLSSADASDAALDWDGDGQTNLQECADGTHPRGLYTRYLAEGATGSFFSTRVVVANPGATPARVLFRFTTHAGATVPHFLLVQPASRRTLDLAALTGLQSANVSSVIESDVEVVVDRTMRWDQATRGGAHAETSVTAPALRWYLAEGATHGFFDLFYLIQNPSLTTAAQVRITFLRPSGPPTIRVYTVNPNTRFTLPVDTVAGLEATDVSGVIESINAVPIIVERAMYSSAAGVFAAGHNSAGVTALSTTWFFAEGATGNFFDYFLLFANPNSSAAANVEARYLLTNGTVVTKQYTIAPDSRRTVYVAAEDPALADAALSVAVTVTNGVPIIVERAMWWPHGQAWFEAHNSAGSTVTGTKWGLGDGEVGFAPEETATFILVANTAAVAANSRFNVPVLPDEVPESPAHFRVPRGTRFSAVIESLGAAPAPIVVERAMYWNANGILWAAGSNLLATRLQ